MSTYYNAYLGKKTKDNQYEIIGPYVYNKNGEQKLNSIWWRSRSFIRWDEWGAYNIPINSFGEKARELCVDDFGNEKRWSIGYWISAKEIHAKASCEPIRGFLPIEEAQMLIASNYDIEYISWDMESKPLRAEFIAGMSDSERSKYSFVSYIDFDSVEYHMWEISCILKGYDDYSLVDRENGEEFGVIFQVA